MTAQIIPFPTHSVRELAEIELIIRENLKTHTDDIDLIDHVASRMKEYIQQYLTRNFSFDLPFGLTNDQQEICINSFNKWTEELHEMTNQIILERLLLEIELYGYERG